ncbi:hypothetical protein NDU88_004322 [Pleurodeles waltl]|uniref:Uncharacterized protein n=1 Tax=Pleurodeles waltl TaxID=8319 RepID=A0AAV7UIW9_PLEWA|nr:hypothetical protein NDU88_004322 [Pleurodeles waltl]
MRWESGYPDSQPNKGQTSAAAREEGEEEKNTEGTRQRLDQQNPEDLEEKGTPDGWQGGSGTRGLRHVPREAWLQQHEGHRREVTRWPPSADNSVPCDAPAAVPAVSLLKDKSEESEYGENWVKRHSK